LALAENSGLDPIGTLTEIKSKQVAENNPALGVNCFRPDDHGEFDWGARSEAGKITLKLVWAELEVLPF